MDFNYDRNVNRRRINNQMAATPYSRPQEKRCIPSVGRPMMTTQDRHTREHISNRYGNALDDIPQQVGLPAMPQTPVQSSFARSRFQTPFASSIACPDSPQMCVVPRAPYSSGGDMEEMMMPIGSPAMPQPRYTDYESMGHCNTPAPRFARRPVDRVVYDHYPEINESLHNSDTHDYNMPGLKSSPQEFAAPFNKNPVPQAYGAFLRDSHHFPSPMMPTQYEESVVPVNAYKKPNHVVAHSRQYLYEPMEEAVEEENFAKLSLDKDSQDRTSRQLVGVKRPAVQQQAVATTPGPLLMSKKGLEPAHSAPKDAAVKNIVMTGPIEKVLKWDALLNANPMILYETIGPLVQVRQGERADEKVVLLRDASTPVLQCVFSEIDRRLPALHPGQLVRCVGKMSSNAKMRCFSVRPATDAEKNCLLRMSYIINRVVNDMSKEKKPASEPTVKE